MNHIEQDDEVIELGTASVETQGGVMPPIEPGGQFTPMGLTND